MSHESNTKNIIVVLGVCLVCSVLVSSAAVSLNRIQQNNKKLDKLENILMAGGLLTEGGDVEKIYRENIQSEIIDLTNGATVPKEKYTALLDPDNFDVKAVARDPEYNMEIPADKDLAQIHRMPKFMAIYKVVENGQVQKYILPIYGKGLWSTMYGLIALDKDLRTVRGFTYYEHGETPGLGGEVDNPRWKQIWQGKQVFDDQWNLKIKVIKGKVDKSSPEAKYQVDGLSGSTLTTRGVDRTVRFWLGENGYGAFIKKLGEESLNG